MGMAAPASEPPWLVHARTWIGLHERPGTAAEASILDFYTDAGHPGVGDDAVPWCAAFVGACLARSGVAPSGLLRARSYLDWGEVVDDGRPGAVVVLSRGASATLGHVGFLVGSEPGRVQVLGGNQDDQVSIAWFSRRRVLGFRWPRDAAGPAVGGGFDAALAHVLALEGGYTDDPRDPGGPTHAGITLATLAADRGIALGAASRARLITTLKTLTPAEIAGIYRRRYWQAARCPQMPAPLALMHFDCAVNQGPGRAAWLLQDALGTEVDGEIGPDTIASARRADPRLAIERYALLRRDAYRALSSFPRFGRGWLARVEKTRQAALALIPAMTSPTKETRPMPTKSQAQTQTPKWWGQSITVWGIAITALTAVLPSLGPVLGLEISAELAAAIGRELTNLVQGGGGLLGTLIAIYGRLRAEGPLIRKRLSVRL
ncbi:MAG: TIGR02594 family protein [Hyphomicrobiaceae bacterium]